MLSNVCCLWFSLVTDSALSHLPRSLLGLDGEWVRRVSLLNVLMYIPVVQSVQYHVPCTVKTNLTQIIGLILIWNQRNEN